MNRRNLMPPARLAAKRRARAVRRWVLIDGAYLLVLTIAGAAYAWHCAAPASADDTAVAVDITKAAAQLATLRQQAGALDAGYKTAVDLSARPDWSALLATLAQRVGDDVVLDTIDCTDVVAGASVSPATPFTTPHRLVLAGIGRSQQAVAAFVLRVENLRFFDRVQLTQTAAQTLRGHDGVGFRVICTMTDWPGGTS